MNNEQPDYITTYIRDQQLFGTPTTQGQVSNLPLQKPALYNFHNILNLNGLHTIAAFAFAFVAGAALHFLPQHYVSLAVGRMANWVGWTKEGDGGSTHSG